jgi:cobalt/nickel transport system permease protein
LRIDEEFTDGSTFLHRLDPRVKWGVAAGFCGITAATQHIEAGVAALGLSLLLLVLARLSVWRLLRRLLVVNVFVAFLWVVLPFTVGERVWAAPAGIPLYREGVALAASITLKSNAIVAALIALPGTSTIFDNIHAFHHLRVPAKLVQLLFFTFRYLHVIAAEYVRLRTAMALRSFRPRTSLHAYKSYAYLLGMLFVRSFERSERIHAAMLCRGFRGTFFTLHHFHLTARDVAIGVAMALAVLAVAGLEWIPQFPLFA